MKVDTYQSGADLNKFLTVRAGTRLSGLPATVTNDPDLQRLTPMALNHDLLSPASQDGFDYVRVTHQIQMSGFAVHTPHRALHLIQHQEKAA